MLSENKSIVELCHISKSFGGIQALDDVSFDLFNEVHSIVGHNGAGKSTLVRILMGALQPDSGEVFLNGKKVEFDSPREAQENKIAMVWQELSNFPNLTVTENLLMQRFVYLKTGGIDWKASHERCRTYLERLNLDINPRMLMGKLPLAHQQLAEFAKALSYDPSVLILDEPTSALSFKEQEILYEKIEIIKKQGVAIVFISHKLDEIMALSDRVTVLRDGQKIFTKTADQLNKDLLVQGIIGSHAEDGEKKKVIQKREYQVSEPVLEVKTLNKDRQLKDVSFTLHKGEVLGITGVSGSGISEIGKVLFGIDTEFTGDVILNGDQVVSHSPHEAVANGFGYVPKDRKEEGIIPGLSVGYNVILSALKFVFVHGFENKRRMNKIVGRILDVIDMRPRDPENLISTLSGGNQQKAVIARWIAKSANVLILDEPTRGVDVGAIEKIYAIIHDMTLDGTSVIIISSEFEEVHSASDRVIVMKKGQIVGEIDPSSHSWKETFSLAIK